MAAWLLLLPGCDRGNATEEGKPSQVVREIISARQRGLYADVGKRVVAERAAELVDTLIAIDGFLSINEELCAYVRRELGPDFAEMIDQSYFGDDLEIFSRKIRVLSEQIDGQTATVAVLINEQVPVRRAQLVKRDGKWYYDPGGGYDPQLPRAFEVLGGGLRLVLEDLKAGRISHEAVQADPEQLAREVMLRLAPGVQLLPGVPSGERAPDDGEPESDDPDPGSVDEP